MLKGPWSLVAASLVVFPLGLGLSVRAQAEPGRSYSLSLPVVSLGFGSLHSRDGTLRGEYNSASLGAISLELSGGAGEAMRSEEAAEVNQSLELQSQEVTVLYTAYGDRERMSGFYWSAGVGYRQSNATWRKTPGEDYALAPAIKLDEQSRASYLLASQGPTAHGRIGYRYCATSVPLTVGTYFGLRHYQNIVRSVEEPGTIAAVPSEQRDLRGRLTSYVQLALDLGFQF